MMVESYVLVEAKPGGLLLDLRSGGLFQLNHSATLIWRYFLAGWSSDQIAEFLSQTFQIHASQARDDTRVALSSPGPVALRSNVEEFHYQREDQGYVFYLRGLPTLVVDADGHRLELVPEVNLAYSDLRRLLVGLVPKLLSLRGHAVLHASAVAIGGQALAFSGISGAGKTTTAKALVQAGAQMICQDKLVLRLDSGAAGAVLGAEAVADAWATDNAGVLGRHRAIACDGLDDVARGTVVELAEIGFLDPSRRWPAALGARLLSPCDAASAVFHHAFHGADSPTAWRRELNQACALAERLPAYEVTPPDNLAKLESEAMGIVTRCSLKA